MVEPYSELQAAIEEEARRNRWGKIWSKFGIYLIVISSVILGSAGLWTFQQSREQKNAMIYSTLYEEARSLFGQGKVGESVQKLQEIIQKGPANYRTMARFLLTAHYTQMNNIEALKQTYQDIINDKGASNFYRGLAQLNWISFQIDHEELSKEQLQQHLATLSNLKNSAIQRLSSEVIGFIHYKMKDYDKAREVFTHLAQLHDIDQGMRTRAQAMVRLIYMETYPQ